MALIVMRTRQHAGCMCWKIDAACMFLMYCKLICMGTGMHASHLCYCDEKSKPQKMSVCCAGSVIPCSSRSFSYVIWTGHAWCTRPVCMQVRDLMRGREKPAEAPPAPAAASSDLPPPPPYPGDLSLPPGWEARFDEGSRKTFYIDHNSKARSHALTAHAIPQSPCYRTMHPPARHFFHGIVFYLNAVPGF